VGEKRKRSDEERPYDSFDRNGTKVESVSCENSYNKLVPGGSCS